MGLEKVGLDQVGTVLDRDRGRELREGKRKRDCLRSSIRARTAARVRRIDICSLCRLRRWRVRGGMGMGMRPGGGCWLIGWLMRTPPLE